MDKGIFSVDKVNLQNTAESALNYAKKLGSTSASVEVGESLGQSVGVRKAKIDTIEFSRDKNLSVTVYHGDRSGYSSTSDLSPDAVKKAVEAASTIAKYTQPDKFSGLPEKSLLVSDPEDLDLYHPIDLGINDALEIANRCEKAAFEADSRILNSDGATFTTGKQIFVLANSLGLMVGYPTTTHSISCAVVAGKGDKMQRDSWWTVARNLDYLESPEAVGKKAGERASRRVGARKIQTQKVPVVFDSSIASSILGHLVSAISGGALYRQQSFLTDSLGVQIFPKNIEVIDQPRIKCGLSSCAFDSEGVVTRDRKIIERGKVKGYFLSSYSARKLGMRSTGNAGGDHNLSMGSTGESLQDILKSISKGFLVTEMLGMGVNGLTGDYSRGAAGFWIENGEIAFPVEEVTVAGNLKDMFKSVVAVGSDGLRRSSRQCGSILIESMTVAGN